MDRSAQDENPPEVQPNKQPQEVPAQPPLREVPVPTKPGDTDAPEAIADPKMKSDIV